MGDLGDFVALVLTKSPKKTFHSDFKSPCIYKLLFIDAGILYSAVRGWLNLVISLPACEKISHIFVRRVAGGSPIVVAANP